MIFAEAKIHRNFSIFFSSLSIPLYTNVRCVCNRKTFFSAFNVCFCANINYMKKKVIYRTHPVYKAVTALSATVAISALAYAWATDIMADGREKRYTDALSACEYEAYLSFTDAIEMLASGDKDASASGLAAEALSRYVIFSGTETDTEALSELLLSGKADAESAKAILRALAEGEDAEESMAKAAKAAEEFGKSSRISSGRRGEGEWRFSSLPEVKERTARELAERLIGGGGEVRQAESHAYPLIYVYENGNATAEISRMGGRLLRMCIFPMGDAAERNEKDCLSKAEAFLEHAKIRGEELFSTLTEPDTVTYVFACEGGGKVTVRVAKKGATVIFFDAYEYYKVV